MTDNSNPFEEMRRWYGGEKFYEKFDQRKSDSDQSYDLTEKQKNKLRVALGYETIPFVGYETEPFVDSMGDSVPIDLYTRLEPELRDLALKFEEILGDNLVEMYGVLPKYTLEQKSKAGIVAYHEWMSRK